MKKMNALGAIALASLIGGPAPVSTQASNDSSRVSAIIIAAERGALDRWSKGDPSGYLEIYAPNIVYFDPSLERRLDGIEAVKKHLEPVRGQISIARYELLNPLVQQVGNAAVLTFNYVAYGADGKVQSRWNLTEVYQNANSRWRIIQSHWSYTQGQPAPTR